MGIYNPDIKEWVRIVHEAGGLCFYDHANFNGVMGKIRARELGFDACMFMLHKTFGAPKAAAARRSAPMAAPPSSRRSCPGPVVKFEGKTLRLNDGEPTSIGKVREYFGNVPQVIKAYAWTRAMGADGIDEASDISVLPTTTWNGAAEDPRRDSLASGDRRLAHRDDALEPGPALRRHRRRRRRGANRMADYGVDAYWMSHEPWVVPEPFTPEAGEMWSKEDIDYWMAVMSRSAMRPMRIPNW